MKNFISRLYLPTLLSLPSLLLPLSAFASYISETVSVGKGWNAVYIESTPESPDASAFFADLAVTKASCYISSVYSATFIW